MLHIQNVHEKSVIYYGWYSNRSRGLRKKQEQDAAAGDSSQHCEPKASLDCRRAWAAMIKRVYEVDPLECPRCGHRPMRVVSDVRSLDAKGLDPCRNCAEQIRGRY